MKFCVYTFVFIYFAKRAEPYYTKLFCGQVGNGKLSCPFSCYGTVSSLNGEPEQGVSVEAVGQKNCAIYGEDTVTDEEGKFRLRGLRVSRKFYLTNIGVTVHECQHKTKSNAAFFL